MAKKVTFSEQDWQREEDARTLARYNEIMNDSKRKAAAMGQVKKEADRLQKQADSYKFALGGKMRKK
jgi:hypothetical protein